MLEGIVERAAWAFEQAYLTRWGSAFQDFFSALMAAAHPADFSLVQPWGPTGDRKSDGYLESGKTIFQVYAPRRFVESKALAKVERDFRGAVHFWKGLFHTWVFVHNQREGLSPSLVKKFAELHAEFPQITVNEWGFLALRKRFLDLSETDMEMLIGSFTHQRVGAILRGDSGREYLVTSEIASGGAGIVYQAIDRETNATRAIKFPKPSARVRSRQRREIDFARETRILCKVLDSPYIVKGLDAGTHAGTPFLVMEYHGSNVLTQRIASPTYSDETAQKWICQLLKSVRELQEKKVAHRDICPQNIIVDREDNLKLADFGTAKQDRVDRMITLPADQLGTLHYSLPPEDPRYKSMPEMKDVYNICVVMYELITGQRISGAFHHPLATLRETRVPREFARLVARGLQESGNLRDIFERMCRLCDLEKETIPDNAADSRRPRARALRVAHVVLNRAYGGIETYISGILSQSRHNHSVHPIGQANGNPYATHYSAFKRLARVAMADLHIDNRPYEQSKPLLERLGHFLEETHLSESDQLGALELRSEIEQAMDRLTGFDLVHCHFIVPAYYAARLGLKTICTSHSLMSQEMLMAERVPSHAQIAEAESCRRDEAVMYQHVKHIVCLSDFHAREIVQIRNSPVHHIGIPFDANDFLDSGTCDLSPEQARRLAGLPELPTILYSGRAAYRKGIEILLEAIAGIKCPVQLLLVGSGFHIHNQTISYGGIAGTIPAVLRDRLLPPRHARSRRELALLYKSANVIACPSLYEPLGYVLIEAALSRRPCVASRVGGIPEVVSDGNTGILVTPGDVSGLRDALGNLVIDQVAASLLGTKGFEMALAQYRSNEAVGSLDNLYSEIVGSM